MAQKYNTSTQDRGLKAVCDEARLPSDLFEQLTAPDGLTQWSTSERLYYGLGLSQEMVENKINALLDNFPKYKRQDRGQPTNHEWQRAQGKLLQCWAVCKEIVRLMGETPPDAEVDLETPLAPQVHEDIQGKFRGRYNLKVRPEFDPDEATITRYYRSLNRRRCALKVFDMKTHRALGKTNGVAAEKGEIRTI